MRRATSEQLAASDPSGLPLSLGGEGREYRAYPSLSRARWLFPADSSVVRRAGISKLFQPNTLKGRVLQRLILVGAIPGGKVLLQDDALTQLEDELARALAEPEVRTAFYTGVPGAYRKITAQVMTASGETLAFAKIAKSQVTKQNVERERRVLLRLSESEGLHGRVPEVLGYFDWQEDKVLLITGGPDEAGPKRLSTAHLELFREVFLPFSQQHVFGESPMMIRMSETLHSLSTQLPEPLLANLDEALGRLRDELGSVRLPLSWAHRDFAPWNTRMGSRGLFVFDWDGARDGTTPLYDAFHFQAIQAALLKRRDHLPGRAFLRSSLDALWPEGHGYLPWLYLSYLLDITLLYSEAQVVAPGIGEQGVWNWFAGQLRSFLEDGPPL